jgi:hypothetical protein
MIQVLKPRSPHKVLFLAGTIDNGNSEDWQARFIEAFEKVQPNSQHWIVVNPRRDDWDPEAKESEILYQITWEMDWIEKADIIYMHFARGSQSPITLQEQGWICGQWPEKLIVTCDIEYFRFTNVERLCNRAGTPFYPSDPTIDIHYNILKYHIFKPQGL